MSLKPSSIRMVVVLPAPFGPSRPKISPSPTLKRRLDGGRRAIALGEAFGLDDRLAHRRPKRATAPTMIRSAAPMMPTPAMPHMVEVVTVTRKLASPVSPREAAVSVVT